MKKLLSILMLSALAFGAIPMTSQASVAKTLAPARHTTSVVKHGKRAKVRKVSLRGRKGRKARKGRGRTVSQAPKAPNPIGQ